MRKYAQIILGFEFILSGATVHVYTKHRWNRVVIREFIARKPKSNRRRDGHTQITIPRFGGSRGIKGEERQGK